LILLLLFILGKCEVPVSLDSDTFLDTKIGKKQLLLGGKKA
jgi:hypothetical protein